MYAVNKYCYILQYRQNYCRLPTRTMYAVNMYCCTLQYRQKYCRLPTHTMYAVNMYCCTLQYRQKYCRLPTHTMYAVNIHILQHQIAKSTGVLLHALRHEGVADVQLHSFLTFLFSLGQYDPKRNLTRHNFFIPKC